MQLEAIYRAVSNPNVHLRTEDGQLIVECTNYNPDLLQQCIVENLTGLIAMKQDPEFCIDMETTGSTWTRECWHLYAQREGTQEAIELFASLLPINLREHRKDVAQAALIALGVNLND